MELTRRQRAEKAVDHARRGSLRASARAQRIQREWWEATEDHRYAQELEAEAEAELKAAIEEAEAVPRVRPAPASATAVVPVPRRDLAGDFVPDDGLEPNR